MTSKLRLPTPLRSTLRQILLLSPAPALQPQPQFTMSPKRPAPVNAHSYSSSSSSYLRSRQDSKRLRTTPSETPPSTAPAIPTTTPQSRPEKLKLRIYIIPSKLPPSDLAALTDLAQTHAGALARTPDGADVVLSAVRMRKRLERHLGAGLVVSRARCVLRLAAGEDGCVHMDTHTLTLNFPPPALHPLTV